MEHCECEGDKERELDTHYAKLLSLSLSKFRTVTQRKQENGGGIRHLIRGRISSTNGVKICFAHSKEGIRNVVVH